MGRATVHGHRPRPRPRRRIGADGAASRRPAAESRQLPAALPHRRARAVRRARGRRRRSLLHDERGEVTSRTAARGQLRQPAGRHRRGPRSAGRGRRHDLPRIRDARAERDRLLPALAQGVASVACSFASSRSTTTGTGSCDGWPRRASREEASRQGRRAPRWRTSSTRARRRHRQGRRRQDDRRGGARRRRPGRGLRTIVAEVARRDDVSRALGDGGRAPRPRGGAGVRPAPHLDRPAGTRWSEYLADQLPSRRSPTCSPRAARSPTSRPPRRGCASC